MRHRKAGTKLNMSSSHRKAMFRNMVTSLLKHDRIRTTNTRAKELRGWVDHIITLAKRGDLHARRQALAIVREKSVVHKLFEEAEKRFGKISGGYTRITKLGRRPGDSAPISIIELITAEEKPKKKKKKKKAKAAQKAAPVTAKAAEKTADAEKTASEASASVEGEKPEAESGQEAAAEPVVEAEPQAADEGDSQAADEAEAKAAEESSESDATGDADEASEQDTEKKED